MNDLVLVSCIMPTCERRRFVPQAISYFLQQDYPQKELIVLDDGTDAVADLIPEDGRIRYVRLEKRLSVAAKRNLGCELARGALIAHWDDDDWMAPTRLSEQVSALTGSGANICGAQELLYYHLQAGQAWLYRSQTGGRCWLAACTLLYYRQVWQDNHFAEQDADANQFVASFDPGRVKPLLDPWFYIALIHSENATARNLNDPRWQRQPISAVSERMGEDRDFYVTLRNGSPAPKIDIRQAYQVSCIMPTYNRRVFVPQAIRYFERQDYPRRELIVVDDSSEPVDDLIPCDERIRYIRLPKRYSIGEKRNLACKEARGEIIIFWDDDDWYAANRISYQVMPLLQGKADITCLSNNIMLWLPTRQFWGCTPWLYNQMFFQGIHGGTIAFWKALWGQSARFPDTSLAEDIGFVSAAQSHRARLERLDNANTFNYVRHHANAWQFTPGSFLDNGGWQQVDAPSFLPRQDLEFYFSSHQPF